MVDDWKRQIDRLQEDLVRRDDPTEWVTEADAVDASYRYPHLAIRGPVFGLATQDADSPEHWRVVKPVTCGTPQEARDDLNSLLWFRAKDGTDDPEERRELLAAVSVLEREPVNELEVLGARYRVVRGDEFARSGDTGLEPPRPTDPDQADTSWDHRDSTPSPDLGFVLDPGRQDGLMAGALRLGLRGFAYLGPKFPPEVCKDSERAITAYPEIMLLPVTFSVGERNSQGWLPRGALLPTPQDARRMLFGAMTEFWPMMHGFDDEQRARFAKAAETFKAAGRADEVSVGDSLFRVCRVERMVRYGADGPEPPRPSDLDDQTPTKIHPTMDEDGTLRYDT